MTVRMDLGLVLSGASPARCALGSAPSTSQSGRPVFRFHTRGRRSDRSRGPFGQPRPEHFLARASKALRPRRVVYGRFLRATGRSSAFSRARWTSAGALEAIYDRTREVTPLTWRFQRAGGGPAGEFVPGQVRTRASVVGPGFHRGRRWVSNVAGFAGSHGFTRTRTAISATQVARCRPYRRPVNATSGTGKA
jgi:hypothetical protein